MIDYGKLVLRIGLGLVFLYFGLNQLIEPTRWVDLIPETFTKFIDPKIIIYLNGIFDILIAFFLFCGIFIKIISILGFIHLIGVSLFSLGFTPSGIRDLGLAFAILSLYFFGEDGFNIKKIFPKLKNER